LSQEINTRYKNDIEKGIDEFLKRIIFLIKLDLESLGVEREYKYPTYDMI